MVSMDNFEFTNAQNTFGVIYIVLLEIQEMLFLLSKTITH